MLCIYHVADHDGKGSAAIVKRIFPETELLGLNHDMEIPYDVIESHDKIVVCDISLPVEYMFKLSETKDFTWIDHHISVINEYDEIMANGEHEPIKGLRRSGTAAIVLTWEYFHPNEEVPVGVKLLGMNDIYESFMLDVSGAAEIPVDKLFGRSPAGFNNGAETLQNYYDSIQEKQETNVHGDLEKLIRIISMSRWISILNRFIGDAPAIS